MFKERPLLGVLLFDNAASDARDHAANERSMCTLRRGHASRSSSLTWLAAFLSWLRLSTYMAVVAVAIILSFHLKSQPTATGTGRGTLAPACSRFCSREKSSPAVRHHLLGPGICVPGQRPRQLHEDGGAVQSAARAGPDGVEDAGCEYLALSTPWDTAERTFEVFTVIVTAIVAACVLFLATDASNR